MSPEEILTAARIASDLLLQLVPKDQAMALLDEAAVRRANALADAAEAVKFGGEGT
jgi:hypothetical protein